MQAILDALPHPLPQSHRFVVAIAGPPAAGKSTLATKLSAALAPKAAVLGMDAFHYDNQLLGSRGDLERKGAPHTFDVDGYAALLGRLRAEPSQSIAVPEFDRSLELTRNAARIVTSSEPILVTEGNYLLLDQEPWRALAPLFDLTVWIDTPMQAIQDRITRRWLDHGLTEAEAAARFTTNDQPNTMLVQSTSRAADIWIG